MPDIDYMFIDDRKLFDEQGHRFDQKQLDTLVADLAKRKEYISIIHPNLTIADPDTLEDLTQRKTSDLQFLSEQITLDIEKRELAKRRQITMKKAFADIRGDHEDSTPVDEDSPSVDEQKSNLIQKLQNYIQRIEKNKLQDTGTPDFEHGFNVLKTTQGLNRRLNYQLAQELIKKLQNSTTTIEAVFQKDALSNLRNQMIDEYPFINNSHFQDRGMHSTELNSIIEEARYLSRPQPGLR